MVNEDNVLFYICKRFVQDFLNIQDASPELIKKWSDKENLNKLKRKLTKKTELPLRPKSKYIYFCEEIRPVIQQEMQEKLPEDNKKINIHDVTCELGKRWRQFKIKPDETLMKKIECLAKEDSTRYHTQKTESSTKKDNENNHLRSLYLFFCREHRIKSPKISMVNLGNLWKENKNDEELYNRYIQACKDNNYTPKKLIKRSQTKMFNYY